MLVLALGWRNRRVTLLVVAMGRIDWAWAGRWSLTLGTGWSWLGVGSTDRGLLMLR